MGGITEEQEQPFLQLLSIVEQYNLLLEIKKNRVDKIPVLLYSCKNIVAISFRTMKFAKNW